MSVDMIDEQELAEALRPFRPDRAAFAAGVQEFLQGRAALAEQDPLNHLPPFARVAAAVLPLPLLTGGKLAVPSVTLSAVQKILGVLLFPAVTLFLLLGSAIFGAAGIRRSKWTGSEKSRSAEEYQGAIKAWRRDHRIASFSVWVGTLALMVLGATDWLFLLYIVSFGLLVVVVRSLASQGLGNRQLMAASLLMAFMVLAQGTSSFMIGAGDIHFLDQRIVSVPFWFGVIYMIATIALNPSLDPDEFGRTQRGGFVVFSLLFLPLMAWNASSILWPTTPASIRRHVEAFDSAPNTTSSWRQWEISASWAIEAGLKPDLTKPRALLAQEMAGSQNPYILGIAFRTGLVRPEQVAQLREFQEDRDRLLGAPGSIWGDRSSAWVSGPISSPEQSDWVVRALILTGGLSDADRDHLATRLHATLQKSFERGFDSLHEVLIVTQLLAAIERPVELEQYRPQVHRLLLDLHSTNWGGFALAGGFKKSPNSTTGDGEATVDAVELMQIYGVPDGLDLNWVRSYAKPQALGMGLSGRWTSAVTRERLAAIPGVEPPTVWQWLYYERSLLAAVVLVGLCIYAVRLSPVVHPHRPTS